MPFRDRTEAGRLLAERLIGYRDRKPAVLGLPRGGVPVAFEIAEALDAPLDVLLARKIGVPFQPELALGAVVDGDDPIVVIDERLKDMLAIPDRYVIQETRRQLAEIDARRALYRKDRPALEVGGRTAIVVDDGIATGQTARAALRGLRRRGPAAIVLAVPVAPSDALATLRPEVDDLVCLEVRDDLAAISLFYDDFTQVDDSVVTDLLRRRDQKGEGHAAVP